jgi:hypothetical protein
VLGRILIFGELRMAVPNSIEEIAMPATSESLVLSLPP